MDERGPQQLHRLTAQSFPGDAAEEGVTLDVTHTPSSRAQAIAGVKLQQLWSTVMVTGLVILQLERWMCVSERPNLSEQGCSRGAQVVGDEQLGVGVDPCRVELPQRLETQQRAEREAEMLSDSELRHINPERLHVPSPSRVQTTPPRDSTSHRPP